MGFSESNVKKIIKTPVYHAGSSTYFTIFLVDETTLDDLQEALNRLEQEGKQKYKRDLLNIEIKSRTTTVPITETKRNRFGIENINEWRKITAFFKDIKEGKVLISRPTVIRQQSKYITWVIHTRR